MGYVHYARLGANDSNGNAIIKTIFSSAQVQYYQYNDQTDIILSSNGIRQAHYWFYTDNGKRLDGKKKAWDATNSKIVEAFILQDYKDEKNKVIDKKTTDLIRTGFDYDSQRFSMSETAQINWLALQVLQSVLTWPVEVTTIDDKGYSLTLAKLTAFINASLTHKQSNLDSGRLLKKQVTAATDKQGIDSVNDTR